MLEKLSGCPINLQCEILNEMWAPTFNPIAMNREKSRHNLPTFVICCPSDVCIMGGFSFHFPIEVCKVCNVYDEEKKTSVFQQRMILASAFLPLKPCRYPTQSKLDEWVWLFACLILSFSYS